MPTDSLADPTWCVSTQRAAAVRELASSLRIPESVARVLINRGAGDVETARQFLNPSSAHLEDPFAFAQMEQAVARILRALENGEKILIQGDYDVDGSASAALLVNLFKLLGHEVAASIPSRAEDGYGLNARVIRDAAERGITLLITCDNGTTANAEIALARELGIDTIVTDHHTVGETLPDTVALLNPHVSTETLRFRDLCGAGVAFKLAWALLLRTSKGGLTQAAKDFLASAQSLVALASIADVVPLTGDNRVLTSFGLRLMPDSPNPGIRALLETSGVESVPTGTDVGFKLAPRLNAGGRLGRESLALELLSASSYGEALKLAAESDVLNRERQAVDRKLTALAEEIVEADASYSEDRILVVAHDNFHPGVVGIVAARISRRFNKPAVLVAMNGETGRGSGRSIPGFHLYNALSECAGLMQRFGGHEQAAGLEITRDKLQHLRRAVNDVAGKHVMQADYATPTLDIDARVPLSELDLATVRLLQSCAPFGQGNPEPLFMADDVEIAGPPRVVGRGTGHLSLMLKQLGREAEPVVAVPDLFSGDSGRRQAVKPGNALKAIGFGMGDRIEQFARGTKVRIAYTPRISTFRGYPELEIELKDIRRAP